MTHDQADAAAGMLVEARTGQPIAALPETAQPQSEADAYAIQERVMERLREQPGGWKVGFSPEGGVFSAPIYSSRILPSPASLPASSLHLLGIECEIGFRLGKDFGARDMPYTENEVLQAALLHPTIEIVDSRYQDFRSLDRLQVLADNFSNGALVCGAAVSFDRWRPLNLARVPIAVTANGREFAECSGLRAGDPVGLLVELVNHLVRRRGSVAAGTFVTTGTHTGLVFTEPGTLIAADYGILGKVEVIFPA
jgi:2-keto-4-pentenoate hydratase